MTAPPPTRMPASFSTYLNFASSSILPASTVAPDSPFSWPPMPPHQEMSVPLPRRPPKGLSAPANEEPANDGGLVFITGGTPADFKSKKVMTTVRKKAMDAFLKSDGKANKKSKSPTARSRFSSVASFGSGSNKSKLSEGSHDTFADFSTIPTTVSHSGGSVARTKASSPNRSSIEPSCHEQDATNTEGSEEIVQQTHDFVLPPPPMFLHCQRGVTIPYDTHTPPPFVSIGKSLDPFRTMFQASHPGVSVEELKFHCNRYFGTRALGRYWIPTALSYPHTFLGTLCLATAYHDVINELPLESVQTIALRQEVIHLVGRNMLDPVTRVSDHNIMAIIQLIISEVIGREESGLRWHEDGIENMILQRGGLVKLGVNGRLASSISWVSLATSVLREEKPRALYAEYSAANSTRQYRPTATLPESPICCPRASWKTIPKSRRCTPEAQDLLSDIRTMIELLLHETRLSRRNSDTLMGLYEKIINFAEYPPISELCRTRVLTQHDYKYEAMRIAAIIQATAIIRRIPLSDALVHAANSVHQQDLYRSSATTLSSDSLVSPLNTYPGLPATDSSISPSYAASATSPASVRQQSYFPTADHRSSVSSLNAPRPSFYSTTSAARPSMSSMHSASSDYIFFPPPPAPAPSNATNLLRYVRKTIESSNISACWSDMAGVLLWIGLVIGAASKKSESKIHKKYFSALTMRAGVMLCFEHPEAINATMVRMSEVVEALGAEKNTQSGGGGEGKRRKTGSK